VFGIGERKPLDEVNYNDALRSGLYTTEEISQIGDRQAKQAGMDFLRMQEQQETIEQYQRDLKDAMVEVRRYMHEASK
jgi:hypothetical protein